MPKSGSRTFEFTDRAVRGLPLPPMPQQFDYFDTKARGLGLRISYGGKRSFFVLYGPASKRQRFTLGEYGRLEDGRLSLVAARRQAKAKLGAVAGGTGDPAAEARAHRKAATLNTVAADFIEAQKARGRKSWRRQEAILKRDILPEIGTVKGRELTRGDVKAMLHKVAERPAPVLANRAHEVIRRLLNWALLQDDYGLEHNPAEKIERHPERSRERYLSEAELGAYWKALDQEPNQKKADALQLCLLTAQRQANVLGMHESKLLLNDGVWLVPASTTKTDRRYKVPLSKAALGIIENLLKETKGGWLFPNRTGDGPINPDSPWHKRAHQDACRRAKIEGYNLHDHRHSFATHADSMGIPRLIWDGILGHVQNGMADLYSGHDFAEKRLACMERWAARIAAAAADNVMVFTCEVKIRR